MYQDLLLNALRSDASQSDVDALGDWFNEFGSDYWNGEYFDCGDGYRLFPRYEVDGDDFLVSGYYFA